MNNGTTGISSKQVAKLKTVFSHIVQTTRLSQESENVATTALCFILNERPEARTGFLKLLGGVLSTELTNLNFKTQQSEENTTQSDSAEPSVENPKKRRSKEQSRPDMVGYDENENAPIVYIENKFWAGLTANQPVSYLKILATQPRPTMLLVVVPDRRSEEVWGEMMRRLSKEEIQIEEAVPKGIIKCAKISLNPHGQKLALTTWGNLIASLEKTSSDPDTRNDIQQLKSLCNQEEYAYHPISSEEMTNLRTPDLVRQLNMIVDEATVRAFDEHIFHEAGKRRITGTSPDGAGKWVAILQDKSCGLWFGLNFKWWSEYGCSPLWAAFSTSNWGRSQEVNKLLKPWADKKGIFATIEQDDGNFIVAIDIPHDKEKEDVILAIVELFAEIGHELSSLPPRKTDAQPVAVEPNLSQG